MSSVIYASCYFLILILLSLSPDVFFSVLQCLKFYCGRWHKVDYSFNQFTTSYAHLLE